MRTEFQKMLATHEPIGLAQNHNCGQCEPGSRRACLIHEAILSARHDIVQAIVQHRGCVNSYLRDGRTTLIEASFRGNREIVKTLLDHGADINLSDHFGNTPIFVTAGTENMEVFDLLINYGANIYINNQTNSNILHRIASFGRIEMLNILANRFPQFLQERMNQANIDGLIPLHAAVVFGKVDIVSLMMESYANSSYKDGWGQTPLHLAALWGKLDIVKILCHYEATEISPVDNGGFTPWDLFNKRFPNHPQHDEYKNILCPSPIYMPNISSQVLSPTTSN